MPCVARPLWRDGRVVYGSGLENRLRVQVLQGV